MFAYQLPKRRTIVACKQNSAGCREVDGINAEQDGFFGVLGDLTVGSEVEETAGRVVGSRSDGVAARVVFDGVDIGLVAFEVLNVVAGSHIPDEGHLVTGLVNKKAILGKFIACFRNGKMTNNF